MAGLTFVGLGLGDERDITVRGLQVVQNADEVFAEFYTSVLSNSNIAKLKHYFGREIVVLNRSQVEDGNIILIAARKKNVVLLTAGDSMMATTHIALRLKAVDLGIKTDIIHNASIITAASGLLGLQNYKFGRTTTIPYSQERYFPESHYETIRGNLKNGMHTLVLLDIDSEKNRYMTANEGIKALLQIEKKRKEHVITGDTLVCVVARAGTENSMLCANIVKNLLEKNFGDCPHCLVIPGKLHYMEIESLIKIAGLPEKIGKAYFNG
ncbi:MAG: diphthine synthase [Thermoplasmata archaeon]